MKYLLFSQTQNEDRNRTEPNKTTGNFLHQSSSLDFCAKH